MENYHEYLEKAKKDVKSDRKAVEKEVLEATGMSAQVDWHKAFEKYKKDEKPTEPKENDLYKQKLEKVNDDLEKGGKVDEYAETDEKHLKSMEGVGRDEHERTDVTKEAVPVQKEAALVRDPDVELKLGTIVRLARTVMTKEGFLLPAGSAWEITAMDGFHYTISANGQSHTISSHDTPKFDTIKKNASQEIENHATREEVLIKIAECASPWKVVEQNGQQVIARVSTEESNTKESEDNKDLQK